jgi:hypothetical protein
MNRISLLLAALLVLPPAEAGILPANALAPGFPEDLLSLPYGSATRFNLKGQPAIGLEQARRGEGRGGGGRRGERGGGRVQRANTGMNRAPRSFDRGNRKPSGGWSRDTVKRRDRDRPSLDRTSFDRSNFGNRGGDGSNRQALRDRMANGNRDAARDRMANWNRDNGNRDNWNRRRDQIRDNKLNDWDRASDRIQNGWNDRRTSFDQNRDKWNDNWNDRRTTFNENRDKWNDELNDRRDRLNQTRDNWNENRDKLSDNWNDRRDRFNDNLNNLGRRVDRAYNRYNNYWPGWVRPGWNRARPWNWGWYGGWSSPPWGWWGVRSAAWGLRSLATAAVINTAVNNAIAASQTTIVVPDTTYQLFFNSVQPSGDQLVYFVVTDGVESRQISADCRTGSLGGQEPSDASEAQLLNAACQVAFGA